MNFSYWQVVVLWNNQQIESVWLEACHTVRIVYRLMTFTVTCIWVNSYLPIATGMKDCIVGLHLKIRKVNLFGNVLLERFGGGLGRPAMGLLAVVLLALAVPCSHGIPLLESGHSLNYSVHYLSSTGHQVDMQSKVMCAVIYFLSLSYNRPYGPLRAVYGWKILKIALCLPRFLWPRMPQGGNWHAHITMICSYINVSLKITNMALTSLRTEGVGHCSICVSLKLVECKYTYLVHGMFFSAAIGKIFIVGRNLQCLIYSVL